MTKGLVTCRKCGKMFNYENHNGVCPKCCRYYSLTNYNEEEAMLRNILSPANEENCSYHGGHDRSNDLSGHSENIHSMDNKVKNISNKAPVKQKKSAVIGVLFIIYVAIYIVITLFSSFD